MLSSNLPDTKFAFIVSELSSNIEVGGKTGSAEAGGNVNAWFVGFAPYDDPEIAVVCVIEHGGHGGYTAPAVKEVMEEYFGYNNANIDEDMKIKSIDEIIVD